MEATVIQAAFVVCWKPVSPNRTAGEHWTVKHRHRKAAGKAWLLGFAGNGIGIETVQSVRRRLSSSTFTPGSAPGDCSTATTT